MMKGYLLELVMIFVIFYLGSCIAGELKKSTRANSVRTIHLVCNAHIDPVWLWEWEEGAAAAISTFRTAADLCEEFDGFIFNHNEVILYQWIEEYEPALFERIKKLVQQGKWHIMGGWYLQPDCNMPCGESFIRQILLGRRYFAEKFGVNPTTAINFDPFGHNRGLVQIMAKSGYDSYIFCRPDDYPLPGDEFIWEGFDGSRVLAIRPYGHYISAAGKAREKVERLIKDRPTEINSMLLWGVGNHGGGPSREDLQQLSELLQETKHIDIKHSTPEAYFVVLKEKAKLLPVHRDDINPAFPGCYTSQVRIKQKHRLLENELYATEKMVTAAWAQGLLAYPHQELHQAMRDLATSEFHDILPGSSIQPVEETSLRLMDHGLEILSRVKARAFFALAQGQPKARQGDIPILVYNPHAFPIQRIIECEFQLADQNWDTTFTQVRVFQNNTELPAQVEQELSHLNLDWRKRVVFAAELAPSQMNRFNCKLETMSAKPKISVKDSQDRIHFNTDDLQVIINSQTGFIERYCVHGTDYLAENAFCPIVIAHNEDSWGTNYKQFRDKVGQFALLSPEASARIAGVKKPTLPPVRVIEDGPVRTVVESLLGFGDSYICQRYKLPKQGTELEVEIRVHWNEKDRQLKLAVPTLFKDATYLGQVAFGVQKLPKNGNEAVAQKWVAVVAPSVNRALTVINDGSYGSDFNDGELRLSLLRSPAYSALTVGTRPLIADQNRYTPRMDQGERLFRFWLNGGAFDDRLEIVDREALAHNEKPMALSFFPAGGYEKPKPFIILSDKAVQISAIKKSEDNSDIIVRLFEPTGKQRSTMISLPFADMGQQIRLNGFEIFTYRINMKERSWQPVNLVEQDLD